MLILFLLQFMLKKKLISEVLKQLFLHVRLYMPHSHPNILPFVFLVLKKYSNNSDKLQLDFFSELHVWGVFEIMIFVPIKAHIM